MRPNAIDYMVATADDKDYIVFLTKFYKPINIKKRLLEYCFVQYCIKIEDKGRKEKYMIQLESVEAIKVIKPKFKGMDWTTGKKETKVGA